MSDSCHWHTNTVFPEKRSPQEGPTGSLGFLPLFYHRKNLFGRSKVLMEKFRITSLPKLFTFLWIHTKRFPNDLCLNELQSCERFPSPYHSWIRSSGGLWSVTRTKNNGPLVRLLSPSPGERGGGCRFLGVSDFKNARSKIRRARIPTQ